MGYLQTPLALDMQVVKECSGIEEVGVLTQMPLSGLLQEQIKTFLEE